MTRKLILCAVALVLAGAAIVKAVDPPTHEVPRASCVTAECHADVKKHDKLHGPVNVNACDACHTQTDVAKHKYKLARPKDKLCAFCHKLEDIEDAKMVHKPVETGDCMGCHDPHGGADDNFLAKADMAKLCNSCHQDVVGKAKHVHGPVAAGACGACHPPHASKTDKLLVDSGKSLCLNCHKEMAQQLKSMTSTHKPLEDGCLQCHDAHASNEIMMIRKAPLDLCTAACHEDVKHSVTEAKFQHSAVTKDTACLNCHTAHGSDLSTLMKSKPVDVCMKCHDKKVTTPDGRTVKSVTSITDPKLNKHGPVQQGSCGGCHNVHGSDVSRLLTKPYPTTFYESFEIDKYGLCFECHDKQLALMPRTKGLTGFRDGEVNLHYVHVNKVKRGRSCRACHSTHASTKPMHVRESVPYGSWELPINFSATANGGSCTPGCHQELGYDRTKVEGAPAPDAPPAPADSPAPASTPAPTTTEESSP